MGKRELHRLWMLMFIPYSALWCFLRGYAEMADKLLRGRNEEELMRNCSPQAARPVMS